jgi:hypothetical protein
MNYRDIKQAYAIIDTLAHKGASVTAIGMSDEHLPIHSIVLGRNTAPHTLLLIAGLHANEIVGTLAALEFLQQFIAKPHNDTRIACIPIADPISLIRNTNLLPEEPNLRDVLKLRIFRDLEGEFTSNNHIECVHIRNWLEHIEQVDAYVSLHTAHRIAPGLFFYISDTSDQNLTQYITKQFKSRIPENILLASHDPTGMTQEVLAEGFFEIPLTQLLLHGEQDFGASLGYIHQQFRPRFIAATETPLGINQGLTGTSIDYIEQYNRNYADKGIIEQPFQEIRANAQIDIMTTFIWSTVQSLTFTAESQ